MIVKDGGSHGGKQRYLLLYSTSSGALSVTASWVHSGCQWEDKSTHNSSAKVYFTQLLCEGVSRWLWS